MKKIIVPTDFSEHANYALKVAAQIAKKQNAEIHLIHMLELPNAGADALSNAHEIPELMLFKNAAVNRLDESINQDFLKGLNVHKQIQFEIAFDGIIKTAEKNDADLIVMGSHGAKGFQEMFIGSNTEKVVRNSKIPVLVIKQEEDSFKANDFVFASDFSEETKESFKKVMRFAENFDAHIHLLNINTPSNFKSSGEAQETMNNYVNEMGVKNYTTHIYNDTNVETGILNFAKNIKADLVGMSTHGRKGLAHFFNGSISEDLVNHAQRPVITFKM